MNTASDAPFNEWFNKECQAGLVDLKLAITCGRGITTQAVRQEMLNIEDLIEKGRLKPLPKPMTVVRPDVASIINAVSI